jgi:hypothetical protein
LNERYILYTIAFSFILVSAFVIISFNEVKIPEDHFTMLYFNSTILENNYTVLDGKELSIRNHAILLDESISYHEGDSFFVNEKGYTVGAVKDNSFLLYNYTKKTNGKIYFEFTIENLEGVDKFYLYEVFIDEKKVLEGNESIKSNEKRIFHKIIEYNEQGNHRLSISINTGAEIHFNFSSVK